MNKKFTSRILSMLLAVLMLISMMPTSVFAAPASDIPAEMLDNVFLDALEYTGYKVQAQRDDGTIFKKYSGGATAYLSKISYGLNKYGTETVAKSGNRARTGYRRIREQRPLLCLFCFVCVLQLSAEHCGH